MCYECFLALCNFLIWMLYLFCHLEGEVIDMDPVVIGALITTVGLLVTNFINDIRVGKKAIASIFMCKIYHSKISSLKINL